MNTTRSILMLILFLLLGTLLPAEASAFKELTDREMNAVTAGSVDPAYESEEALRRVPFHFTSAKGKVEGEVFVLPLSRTSYSSQGTLQLMDNAQSNLRSFINVNAVNSPVQILLNLNININSTIGNMNQINDLLSTQGVRP